MPTTLLYEINQVTDVIDQCRDTISIYQFFLYKLLKENENLKWN